MTTLLFTHPAMLDHRGPPGHPERPERLAAVLAALKDLNLETREAPEATREALARVHPELFIAAVERAAPRAGQGMIALDSGDTFMSDASWEAALRAAGGVVAAVDAVMAGEAANAFCAVRPPGHHAEPAQAMGFCLFSNIAVGALHALDGHGLSRVAVVDFDVHHGNGTQAVAQKEPRLFFASTHQSPLYPGTGRASERGPANNVLNAPLPPGADGAAFRQAFTAEVLPTLEAFAPEFLFISAGFDAHTRDPLADMHLLEGDYAWATEELKQVAARNCGGRIVSALEGGYDLQALAASARAHVAALMS